MSARLLIVFSLAAVGAGAGRALTTTYLPVLLERIDDAPALIGVVMTVNALAGFAVPIATGVWSDRRGRRLPFIAGGAVATAGGLVAIGLGNASSYLALAAAAALAYAGLNALTTAHRTIVADDVEDARRPAATSAQEGAGLVGAVLAVAIGGALIEPAPAAAFALAALVVGLAVLPTLAVSRRFGLGEHAAATAGARPPRARLRDALRREGAREVLLAQTLWVFAYAALPAFFVLYAEDSLGLGIATAGVLPLGFGGAHGGRDAAGARAPAPSTCIRSCWPARRCSAPACSPPRRPRAWRPPCPRSRWPLSAPASSPRSASPTSRASCPTARRAATAGCSSRAGRSPPRPRCRWPASRSR